MSGKQLWDEIAEKARLAGWSDSERAFEFRLARDKAGEWQALRPFPGNGKTPVAEWSDEGVIELSDGLCHVERDSHVPRICVYDPGVGWQPIARSDQEVNLEILRRVRQATDDLMELLDAYEGLRQKSLEMIEAWDR